MSLFSIHASTSSRSAPGTITMSDWAGVTTPPTVWTASCWTTPSMGATSRWMRARCEALTTSWESDAARVSTSASSARRLRLNSISITCDWLRASARAARSLVQTVPGHGQLLDLLHALLLDLQVLQAAHELVVEQLPVGRGALGQHRHDQLQPFAVGPGRLDGRLALLDEQPRGFQAALVLAPLIAEPSLLKLRQLGVDPLRRVEPMASGDERPESFARPAGRPDARGRVGSGPLHWPSDPARAALVPSAPPDPRARGWPG